MEKNASYEKQSIDEFINEESKKEWHEKCEFNMRQAKMANDAKKRYKDEREESILSDKQTIHESNELLIQISKDIRGIKNWVDFWSVLAIIGGITWIIIIILSNRYLF